MAASLQASRGDRYCITYDVVGRRALTCHRGDTASQVHVGCRDREGVFSSRQVHGCRMNEARDARR